MPSLASLPSMPRGVNIPSLPRGVSLPRPVVMSTVSAAPRRLLQDCCSVLDHQSAEGETTHTGVLVLQLVLQLVLLLVPLPLIQLVLVPVSACNVKHEDCCSLEAAGAFKVLKERSLDYSLIRC